MRTGARLNAMTKLYARWAWIYREMYQSIFDCRKEFGRFRSALERYGCESVLELGCGTGGLAPYFLAAGYTYTGVDLSREMLTIAQREHPKARFAHGDMRRFSVPRKVDSVLVAGRSFAHLSRNQDVLAALRSIHKALKPGGILIFDNFDARKIFTKFRKRTRQNIRREGRRFVRESRLTPNLKTGWTWNWDARYVVHDELRKRRFRDRSLLRAFTPDELRLFLTLAGFETLRMSRRGAVMLAVARKAGLADTKIGGGRVNQRNFRD